MTPPPTKGPPAAPRDAGRRAATDRRHQRVLSTITTAIAEGRPGDLSVAAVARAARVHRSYLYRHPELLDLLHDAARAPSGQVDGDRVTEVSLRADLAHARDRARRAEDDNRHLRQRLSEALGEQIWADTGLSPSREAAALRAEAEQLRQQILELRADLEERDGELDACRGANRELMAQVNARR